jgi:hypothetical protein
MIVYLDACALVKRYVSEVGSHDVIALTTSAAANGSSALSRVEVAAAFARAARLGALDLRTAQQAQRRFTREWPDFVRVPVTDALLGRAEKLAWDQNLRGYDAVQLASALWWQDSLGHEVVLATYDRQLWEAASSVGLSAWPPALAP